MTRPETWATCVCCLLARRCCRCSGKRYAVKARQTQSLPFLRVSLKRALSLTSFRHSSAHAFWKVVGARRRVAWGAARLPLLYPLPRPMRGWWREEKGDSDDILGY